MHAYKPPIFLVQIRPFLLFHLMLFIAGDICNEANLTCIKKCPESKGLLEVPAR